MNKIDEIMQEFDNEFVDKLKAHGGDGNAWHGEEGLEYWDTLKNSDDEGTVEKLKAFIRKALTEQKKNYENDIKNLKEALMWCEGSSDFGIGGQARQGWEKGVMPLLEK
jgi:hypothetical protein